MWIGAHVSTAGGLTTAVDRAEAIDADAMQIFGSPPQMWRFKRPPDEAMAQFKERAAEAKLGPTYLHGIYLTNLAAEDPEKLRKGIESLKSYMDLAAGIDAGGVIFHTGSHKGVGFETVLPQVVASLREVLGDAPEGPYLCLENSAGAGNSIGRDFAELAAILDEVDDDRLRICLDTCHLFAAGYDVTTTEALDTLFDEFDRVVGKEKLVAIHANDSKKPIGSALDRHENIGEGCIGIEGWRAIANHPRLQDLPLYLEVPGFEGDGPDKRNVEIMKSLLAG